MKWRIKKRAIFVDPFDPEEMIIDKPAKPRAVRNNQTRIAFQAAYAYHDRHARYIKDFIKKIQSRNEVDDKKETRYKRLKGTEATETEVNRYFAQEEQCDRKYVREAFKHEELERFLSQGWQSIASDYEKDVIVPLETAFNGEYWSKDAARAKKEYTQLIFKLKLNHKELAHLKTVAGILEYYRYLNMKYKEQIVFHTDARRDEEIQLQSKIEFCRKELSELEEHKTKLTDSDRT